MCVCVCGCVRVFVCLTLAVIVVILCLIAHRGGHVIFVIVYLMVIGCVDVSRTAAPLSGAQ